MPVEVSHKGYEAYVNQLVETIARYGNYKVIPSQVHWSLFIDLMGNETKYCITCIPQNASLYMSGTYYNGNSVLSWKHKNKRDNIFLQHDDNAFLSLALNGSGHLHTSATVGLDDSTGTLEAMQKTKVSAHDRHCVQVPWSSSLQPTIMLAELEYFILKTDIQTWSLWVLIYCHRALMIAGRVWVWTPRSLAKRGSSLNWRGW